MSTSNYFKDFLHLIYPVICLGCGSDEIEGDQLLCVECFNNLPATNFFAIQNNIIEQKFYGRAKIEHAGSAFFYYKDSLLQRLLKELKYKNGKDYGLYLGNLLASALDKAEWLKEINLLLPLPLSKERKFKRGYNQSTILAEPLSTRYSLPIEEHALIRTVHTESQTHKSREERWNSMQHVFSLVNPDAFRKRHVLVIDDVITTGATLEVLCNVLLQVPDVKVSVATLACAY